MARGTRTPTADTSFLLLSFSINGGWGDLPAPPPKEKARRAIWRGH
nr:MAG TPA: Protein transport protein SEC31 [Caudoviricetes sp.]